MGATYRASKPKEKLADILKPYISKWGFSKPQYKKLQLLFLQFFYQWITRWWSVDLLLIWFTTNFPCKAKTGTKHPIITMLRFTLYKRGFPRKVEDPKLRLSSHNQGKYHVIARIINVIWSFRSGKTHSLWKQDAPAVFNLKRIIFLINLQVQLIESGIASEEILIHETKQYI